MNPNKALKLVREQIREFALEDLESGETENPFAPGSTAARIWEEAMREERGLCQCVKCNCPNETKRRLCGDCVKERHQVALFNKATPAPLAFYNEIDPFAAEWLRQLIREGHIAPGVVDERSIEDILPVELTGYRQCHFFAGIGVWSHALRSAGWPDDRPVWTGSCPCQPFSPAGKRKGTADQRHLWPAFFHLIKECRPVVVFGEQVESKDGLRWIDTLHDDLESIGFAVGATSFPAAGLGAPHKRSRLYFVADNEGNGLQRREGNYSIGGGKGNGLDNSEATKRGRAGRTPDKGGRTMEDRRSGNCSQLANSELSERRPEHIACGDIQREDCVPQGQESTSGLQRSSATVIMGDSESETLQGWRLSGSVAFGSPADQWRSIPSGITSGFWRSADWVLCRDIDGPKIRPIESGSFPLVNGTPARMGRLRGYGNAIVAPAAEAFIRAYIETKEEGEE